MVERASVPANQLKKDLLIFPGKNSLWQKPETHAF
jgi:hypothetical protein